MEVDYLKLSEQYASFLVAIGGVSITVLALVLSFNPAKTNAFLVAALIVATISCFTGAHMMAETASFITYSKETPTPLSGERLFLLASINIFISIILVIFALTSLPIVSGKVEVARIKLILISVFLFVIVAALSWMVLSVYRMPAPQGWLPIVITAAASLAWGFILFLISKKYSLLGWSFIPIIVFTFASFLRFALTFSDGGKVGNIDIWLFSLAVTSTCVSFGVVGIQSLKSEIWNLRAKDYCRKRTVIRRGRAGSDFLKRRR